MAVTKAELSNALFDKIGLNKREAKDFIELFFESVRAQLEQEKTVKLSGFGNFDVRYKKSRPGRNPKTGDVVTVTARRVVTFKASPKLKEQISDNTEMLINKLAK